MFDVIFLALGLSLDATAVAAGRAVTGMGRVTAIVLAISFGAFHAGMTMLGWALGLAAKGLIERWDHWIAFGLLTAIGGKMVVDARRPTASSATKRLGMRMLLLLSIATSIDALAVGVTLPLLAVPELGAIVAIGVAAMLCTLVGAFAGAALGARFGRRLEMAGGLALVVVGLKTLIDHLSRT